MASTQKLAADLEVGDLIHFEPGARRVLAVSPVRGGHVTVLVDGFGDWQIGATFPVNMAAAAAFADAMKEVL